MKAGREAKFVVISFQHTQQPLLNDLLSFEFVLFVKIFLGNHLLLSICFNEKRVTITIDISLFNQLLFTFSRSDRSVFYIIIDITFEHRSRQQQTNDRFIIINANI